MVEHNLADQANPFLMPPLDERAQRSGGNARLGRMLQARDSRSAQEVVESGDLLGNQIVGNDGHTERAAGDLPGLPCMPIAEPPCVPQLSSKAHIIDLLIEESI